MGFRRVWSRVSGAVATGALMAALVTGSTLAADESVAIAGFAFDPAAVTVSVGDTVTWTNGDGVGHTATADGGAFDTGTIAGGGSDSVTFSAAGTFAYHCTIHPAMTGTVTVQAAAGGAGGSTATTPPTDVAATSDAAATTPPLAPIALVVVAASWLAGMALARRRLNGPDVANQSWTDSSAGNPARGGAPGSRG
ncbi:MAG TPA: cupredoxin family copper-binding protein [Candidatus Limnocylindrales bacterium]|nr:cupredoxin family copper-binding protein [Candidatus Limnocylindrales bacterium]